MSWTTEQKLTCLMRLPWTLVPEVSPEGDRLLRAAELPSAVGTGDTAEAVEKDFWDSLRETLSTYLHFGDRIPLPPAVRSLPWEMSAERLAGPRWIALIAREDVVAQLPTAAATPADTGPELAVA